MNGLEHVPDASYCTAGRRIVSALMCYPTPDFHNYRRLLARLSVTLWWRHLDQLELRDRSPLLSMLIMHEVCK